MAKDKKKKLTSITIADEFGNTQTINPTGKTGGYSYNSKTGVSTNVRTGEKSPALSAVGNNRIQDIRTIKNQQNGTNDIRTVKTEDTQKNLRDAENNLNLKTAERQKKESEIYEKAGQTFQTKFENPQTQTLTYDSKGKKKTALPEQKISPKEVRKQVSREISEEQEAYDQWKWANYENNLAKANEEKIGLWDKTLGNITRGASSIFSPLVVGEDLTIKDEKGNKTYLPSKAELKQQAVQNSYGDNLIGGIAKAGGDILYGGGKMLGATALDIPTAGIGGKSLYWTSMALDNYKQNINDGYSKDKSLKNTLTNTAIQYISDRMLGGLTKVTTGGEISELEKLVGNQLGKVMKDSVAKEYLSKMISEGASEGLEEILGAISDKVTLGKDIDIPDLIKRTAYSGLLGAGTAGFVNASMSLPSTVMQGGMQNGDVSNSNDNVIPNTNQIREIVEQKNNGQIDVEEANQRIADVQNGTYQQNQNNQAVIQEARRQFDAIQQAEASGVMDSETANQERQALTNTINQMTQQNETQEGVVQEVQRQLKPTNTDDKVQNFRNSVENENIEDANGFYKSVEKIIKDKDYNIVLDSSITNENGQSVNALISNDNGVTIKINPKSERAGEILLMHEVTHGIETKEMSNLIMDFAKKNSEFNSALENLKEIYGTEDVTPEVVADISGQLLGNQEFINSLSTENPSIFKKILDALTSLKNKLTGNSKYENFVKDLEVKWQKAYREANQNTFNKSLKESAMYSQNSQITDDQGRNITEEQKEYFKNTKVVDDEGHLITVYHTTSDEINPFYVFDPRGTKNYQYDNDVVIFATDDATMSESYAGEQDFKNVDTSKDADTNKKAAWRYEMYMNITNPYIVDCNGRMYHNAVIEFTDKINNLFKEVEEYKTELNELAKESESKFKNSQEKGSYMDKEISNRIYKNIDNDLISDTNLEKLNDYKDFYEKAKKEGYDLPTPDTMIEDLMYDSEEVDYLIEQYGENRVEKYLDMTIEDFINKARGQEKYESESDYFERNYRNIIGNILDETGEAEEKEWFAKHENTFTGKDWYNIAKEMFTQESKEFNAPRKYQRNTNQIVKYILSENKTNLQKEKYDGVIFKNIIDTADIENLSKYKPANVYVAFDPNQVKAIDNKTPTSNPDIRYSKDGKKWQEFLDKYFKERGTTTKLNEKIVPKQGPALAKVGKAETKQIAKPSIKEIRQEVEEKTNKTMSKHIETSSKATNTVEDIKNMNYDDIVYDTKTHKKSQEQALRELQGKDIDTNINDIHAKFRGTERLTNVDSAKITELMKQTKALADEAAKNGNDPERNKRMEQFRTLKGDYAVALSESGQFTEYAKVIKELDPETQVDVLRKVIEKEQRRGNKKYEDVTLNEDLIKKYKEAKTDEERDAIMEEIKDDTARQIKITFADKANEFRFLSMLGNIKTHGRNIFGNVGMYSLQSFKDGVATIGENVYNKVSKNGLETRSKTLKPATKEVSKFVNDKVDSFLKDQKSKYNESRGMKGDLEERTKKFSDNNVIGKALNKASNLNARALNWEDRFFSSLMTKQAMKGFLTANGIETNADIEAHPELVAQALDYALFKGKEATFHQDSTTATAIRNFRDKLYTGSGFSKLGGLAIDTTLPFVSTPANIAKNALEYTPIIGFGDINKQFQNAPKNMKANVLIDSLSKQFTGGALMAVGAYLASQGLVKGSGDDDKEDKTEASLGNASYSVKIGNSTYDLSWLSPTAIPFFEGVEVFNAYKKANSKGGIKATDTADLIDTMFGTLNPMTDMSVLQSIERVITSITYGGNAVKSAASTTFSSYLQQYIPTLLSQIAQVGDTKQRNTNTGGNVLEKTWDQIQYKIPGRRNTLPEKVDVWGNTNKTASNIWQRGFEAFLSPANRKDYKVDNTTKELERLARETDDTAMLPTVKNKKLRVNGEDYDLKGKDYVNLQKTYGKTAKENLDELIESDVYKNADDNEKKSMVGKLYDYASYKAKEKYAKNKGIDFDSGNQTSFAMIDAFEIPYEKYVENQVSGNDSASKMLDKLNGAGLSEAQKGAVMNYFDRAYYVNEDELYNTLDNSDLSDKQKELIRTKYKNSITDKERERYQRADNIGVDYDLYTNFRSFVNSARGESRTGGPTKKQKVINWIQDQELTAQQKQSLYNDYINNQGIFSYYK